MTALAVIVPCRNEALVLERKLTNLARCAWPAASRPHQLIVVDDGSDDETRRVAGEWIERLAPTWRAAGVTARVLENDVRPGKTGAIEQALRAGGADSDVVVLTDADVVLAPDALSELVRALEREPRAGMVCGGQRIVASLAGDGSLTGADGRPLARRGSSYDALTAWVRRAESSVGAVFSVHGQLMAWRAPLDLHPTRGFAADDLDLMLQVRCLGARVVFAPRALFFETRPGDPADRKAQGARRTRAFLQFLAHPRRAELAAAGPAAWRLQAAVYLNLPVLCAAVLAACFGVYVGSWFLELDAWLAWSLRIASLAVSLPLALLVRGTFGRADAATRASGRPLKDRWETARK